MLILTTKVGAIAAANGCTPCIVVTQKGGGRNQKRMGCNVYSEAGQSGMALSSSIQDAVARFLPF